MVIWVVSPYNQDDKKKKFDLQCALYFDMCMFVLYNSFTIIHWSNSMQGKTDY